MTRTSLFLAIIGAASGCQPAREQPYPKWAETTPTYEPQPSSNAFDSYVLASRSAIAAAPVEADRVAFSETAKKIALAKLASSLKACAAATGRPSEFKWTTPGPFSAHSEAKGWRLLGRGMAWKIEQAVAIGKLEEAVKWTVIATKFGLDLTQGDAETASLGFAICREAQDVLAPQLPKLTATQAQSLYTGLAKVLKSFPGLSKTVANERQRILLGIQFIQDCKQRKSFKELEEQFGRTVRPAVDHLKGLSDTKRVAYFEDFVKSTGAFCEEWQRQIDQPRPERTIQADIQNAGPWRRFGRALCGTLAPLSNIYDLSMAKTKVLATSAWAMARAKQQGRAPYNLEGLPLQVCNDPFSGKRLVYAASGIDFKVYSLGADGRDDGGDSNETGVEPDVVLTAGS